MSQKKIKLINKFLKVRHLDKLIIADNGIKNLSKEFKHFYSHLPWTKKSSFTQNLKEDNEIAK